MTAHAVINGRTFPIDVDGDMDDSGRAFNIFRWEGEIPICPACDEPMACKVRIGYDDGEALCDCGASFPFRNH